MNVTQEPIAIALSETQRRLLRAGLAEWGGPATCTEELSRAMGFDSVHDLSIQSRRLRPMLSAGDALSALDWRRTLLATEIVFASSVVGSGCDWSITTGLTDEETLKELREVQRRIGAATAGRPGSQIGTRPRPRMLY